MIYTIGHSSLEADAFVELLRAHGIRQLADVRTLPASRRHPHFNREALETALPPHGVAYRHFPALGGRRRPRPDSPNTAWQHPAFRGYADYMETPVFQTGLAALCDFAQGAPTAIMCAEAVWWKCHRRLLADVLVAGGVPVFHILSAAAPKPHELSEFARIEAGRLLYPGLL